MIFIIAQRLSKAFPNSCRKQERLDWMYQGGMVAKQEAEKRADAQLLGEKDVDLPAIEEPSKVAVIFPSQVLPLHRQG